MRKRRFVAPSRGVVGPVPDVAAYGQVCKKMIKELEFSRINSSISMEKLKFTTAIPARYL